MCFLLEFLSYAEVNCCPWSQTDVTNDSSAAISHCCLSVFHSAAGTDAVPSQSPASWTAMLRIQLRCQWGSGLERRFSAIKLLLLAGKDSKWQLLGGVLFHTRHVPVACPKCPVLVSAGRDGTCRGVRGVSSAQHFYIKLDLSFSGLRRQSHSSSSRTC